jgi:Polyketide cyclase / dehydrase and lipid transport
MSEDLVSVQTFIPATAQRLFDIVADPTQHPMIDGSGTVRGARAGNPERLALGATFSMDMRQIFGYRIVNTVVEFEEGRLIAWRHFYGHRWRYLFEPGEEGTFVTEQWDPRPSKGRGLLIALGYAARNRAGITQSLERLRALATQRPS